MTALVSAVGKTSLAVYFESLDERSSMQAGSGATNDTKRNIRVIKPNLMLCVQISPCTQKTLPSAIINYLLWRW
jgi:hypothetical protein